MRKLVTYCSLFILFSLIACSSGKQDLQRGNYESSIKKSIERLRSNPNNKKAQATLQEAYPLTLNFHQNRIQNLKTSTQAFKWEDILSSYARLNAIYEDLQRCPTCLRIVNNPQNFTAEAENARKEAAEARYQAGIIALHQQERKAAQQAYRHFKQVDRLLANYKDTQLKLQESLNQATLKIVVEQVPAPFNQTAVTSDYFNERLFDYLKRNPNPNSFVRLYAARDARDANIQQPDHYVMMSFQNLVIGNANIQESVQEASKDSVIIGQVEVDGASRDVYGTVTAKITTYNKSVKVNGLLNMRIIDAYTNQTKLEQQFPHEYVWTNQWGNFNGDERALTPEQVRICNEKEQPLPQNNIFFQQFSDPLLNQVTNRIWTYYKNL